MAEQEQEQGASKVTRTTGVQLPAKNLKTVKPLLDELAKTGIQMKRASLADRLHVSVKSSGFIQKIATAKYLGLLDQVGEKLAVTERGERYLNGELEAAQEGFMMSAFGQLTGDLVGRTIDQGMVALHMTEKLGVPQASAPRFAGVFLDVATEADLLRDGRLSAERIEELEGLVTEAAVEKKATTTSKRDAGHKQASPNVAGYSSEQPSLNSQRPPHVSSNTEGRESSVSVVLHLNTVPLTLEDSVRLIEKVSNQGIDILVKQDASGSEDDD